MILFVIYAVLTTLSIFVVGYSKGVCDTLLFHFSISTYSQKNPLFWNPSISWKNKYKDFDAGDKSPAFPFATTWLVLFTDAWHLFQFVQNVAICLTAVFFALCVLTAPLCMGFAFGIVAFVILRGILQIGFLIAYQKNPVQSAINTLNEAGGFQIVRKIQKDTDIIL